MGRSPLEAYGEFEGALRRALGQRVKESEADACALWAALSNVKWHHEAFAGQVSYTWRYAGGIVGDLREDGTDYPEWYMCAPAGVVAGWIRDAMAAEGWACDV